MEKFGKKSHIFDKIIVLREKYNSKANSNKFENLPSSSETYATSFSLNLPDTININKGAKLKLKHGFVNVTPSSVLNKLEYEITPKGSSSLNGIVYNDNVITANEIGSYTIKFKMPKTESSYYSKTITVVVYPIDEEIFINQNSNSLTIGETKSVYELFTFATNKSFNMSVDNKLQLYNNEITACELGVSNILFSFTENYMEFIYDFNLIIKEEPAYKIVLTNNTITIDLADNEYAYIYYQVTDRDEHFVTQDIDAISQDENIAIKVQIANDNTIKIKGLVAGETIITIFLTADESIKVDVRVIVI